MNRNALFAAFVLTLSGAAIAACSSSSTPGATPGACTQGEVLACTCASGASGSRNCGDTTCTCGDGGGSQSDSGGGGTDSGNGEGDGGHLHDGGSPSQLYADAAMGSFGWPCTPDQSGVTSPDCTDTMYPDCFVGGQGSWCTKTCTSATVATDCPNPPTEGQCNGKGYCK